MTSVSLDDQIAELERELHQRTHVYWRMIEQGKLSPQQAQTRMLRMNAAIETLKQVRDARGRA